MDDIIIVHFPNLNQDAYNFHKHFLYTFVVILWPTAPFHDMRLLFTPSSDINPLYHVNLGWLSDLQFRLLSPKTIFMYLVIRKCTFVLSERANFSEGFAKICRWNIIEKNKSVSKIPGMEERRWRRTRRRLLWEWTEQSWYTPACLPNPHRSPFPSWLRYTLHSCKNNKFWFNKYKRTQIKRSE